MQARSSDGCAMRCAGRFASTAPPSRSTGASAGRSIPDDGSTSEELLARADGQMYATKRDTIDESMLLRRGIDAGIVRDVESALEQNELLVVYQPILDLATGTPRSAEALIRRVLPDGVLVPPAEFVPHVERTPLVRELTFLVVADALGSAQLWAEAGHDLGVSINVPYRLLDDPQFADGLATMLALVRPRAAQRHPGGRPGRAGRGHAARRGDPRAVRRPRRAALARRRRPRRLVRGAARPPARRAEDRRRLRARPREERRPTPRSCAG